MALNQQQLNQQQQQQRCEFFKANSSQHQHYHENGVRETAKFLRRSNQGHHYGSRIHGSH